MKRRLSLLIILVIIASAFIVVPRFRGERSEPVETAVFRTPPAQCFTREVIATPEAPYAVSERVELAIDGEIVRGRKSGTQSGLDMTNGYEGTLSGTKNGQNLSLLFSYTIEGSSQSEQEEYVLSGDTLIKHRYPLIDDYSGILVPDKTKLFVEQAYSEIDCSAE